MTSDSRQADVIIAGAGPGGTTAAALLAQIGWNVLLVDRAQFPRDKTCGDGLTPRAIAVLQRLGLLDRLWAAGHETLHGARVVAPTGEVLDVRFDRYAPALGLPQIAMAVPRYELDQILLQHAVACGAHFCPSVHVSRPILEDGQVVGVEGTGNGGAFAARAPLTILATGANIGLLRSFGVLQQMPPGVNAVRAYYSGVTDLTDEFEFYFEQDIASGYAWVFPVAGGRANIGIGYFARTSKVKPPDVKKLLTSFLARHERFRGALQEGPVKGFPLRTDFPSHTPIGPGFLILGESLGLVNPATGEGIDFAMESAELAAQVADLALGRHDTTRHGLRPYARLLDRHYSSLFRGLQVITQLAMRPRAISILVHKARSKPHLAQMIAGVTLAAVSPWCAFSPRVWWDILT